MFGYVTIRKDDLKVKDYNKYQAYYCGLCQDIKEAYGKKGQAMLTFDMTFLSILLTGLYECETKEEEHYCFLHPGKKHKCLRNKYTKYCADMNVLLAYYNLLDDWEDEKNYAAFTAAKALKKSVTRIEASYPRQTKAVQDYLEKLHACEKENNPDLDLAAGYTGEVMAEIYIPEEDIWSDDLRQVGFYIGKFIYLMDALDDVEKEAKETLEKIKIFLRNNLELELNSKTQIFKNKQGVNFCGYKINEYRMKIRDKGKRKLIQQQQQLHE